MSNSAQNDVSLDDLSKEELKDLIIKERASVKRLKKTFRDDIQDTEEALRMAIHTREIALESLAMSDNVIIGLVEMFITKTTEAEIRHSKELSEKFSA